MRFTSNLCCVVGILSIARPALSWSTVGDGISALYGGYALEEGGSTRACIDAAMINVQLPFEGIHYAIEASSAMTSVQGAAVVASKTEPFSIETKLRCVHITAAGSGSLEIQVAAPLDEHNVTSALLMCGKDFEVDPEMRFTLFRPAAAGSPGSGGHTGPCKAIEAVQNPLKAFIGGYVGSSADKGAQACVRNRTVAIATVFEQTSYYVRNTTARRLSSAWDALGAVVAVAQVTKSHSSDRTDHGKGVPSEGEEAYACVELERSNQIVAVLREVRRYNQTDSFQDAVETCIDHTRDPSSSNTTVIARLEADSTASACKPAELVQGARSLPWQMGSHGLEQYEGVASLRSFGYACIEAKGEAPGRVDMGQPTVNQSSLVVHATVQVDGNATAFLAHSQEDSAIACYAFRKDGSSHHDTSEPMHLDVVELVAGSTAGLDFQAGECSEAIQDGHLDRAPIEFQLRYDMAVDGSATGNATAAEACSVVSEPVPSGDLVKQQWDAGWPSTMQLAFQDGSASKTMCVAGRAISVASNNSVTLGTVVASVSFSDDSGYSTVALVHQANHSVESNHSDFGNTSWACMYFDRQSATVGDYSLKMWSISMPPEMAYGRAAKAHCEALVAGEASGPAPLSEVQTEKDMQDSDWTCGISSHFVHWASNSTMAGSVNGSLQVSAGSQGGESLDDRFCIDGQVL